MFDTLNIPITVHCAIPITECNPSILVAMAEPVETDVDEALAENFAARMGGRSVGALRQEMADKGITIGSGAIQAAKAGSRGLRLETLQKFADFFGCSVYDLIRPGDRGDAWPFGDALTRAQFNALDSAAIQAALDVLVSAAKRQAVMTKLGAPAPATDARVGQFIDPAPPHALDSGYGGLEEAGAKPYRGRNIKPYHPAKTAPRKGRKER